MVAPFGSEARQLPLCQRRLSVAHASVNVKNRVYRWVEARRANNFPLETKT